MFRRFFTPRPARRTRVLTPSVDRLEGRSLMSTFQASFNPGGGIYSVDSLTGLGHHQDGALLTTHLDGIGIANFSLGKTSTGVDDAFVQAIGSDEIYKYTASTGFVDQHIAMTTVEALPTGGAFGIGPNGNLMGYTEATGWASEGGSGIKNISVGYTPQGTPQVFLTNTSNEVYIWSASTGGVDQHGQLNSIDALGDGTAYGINATGAVFHYVPGHGWSSLGVTGITSLSVGHDKSGTEDLYLQGANDEIYLDAGGQGIVDLHGQLTDLSPSNNGTMYGIGLDGELFVFTTGVGFKGLGGAKIDKIAVGTDASGADEVYTDSSVVTVTGLVDLSTVDEYRPSTGLVPIIDDVSM